MVYGIGTVGGLHLVSDDSGAILGVGSHPALARHLACRSADVMFDDLQKSEPQDFPAGLVEAWAQATAEVQALQRG